MNEKETAFFRNVFLWMFLGLMFTFAVGFAASGMQIYIDFLNAPFGFIGLVIVELALVFGLSMFIKKLPFFVALLLFFLYSLVSGLTFAAIFLVFSVSSIIMVFAITSAIFALLCILGYTTKADLTSLGTILFVTLIGLILATLVNVFLNNPLFELILTVLGIIIFMGLTVFDINSLKKLIEGVESKEELGKLAVFGALQLYLDFINIFLNLLNLLGDRD